MIDLKLEVKKYILDNLLHKVIENSSNNSRNSRLRGLVLDQNSTKLLASCFTMDELAAEGITFIDRISNNGRSLFTNTKRK